MVIVNSLFYVSGNLQTYALFEILYLKIAGLVIIAAAMITMITAQIQMKDNWRIGIDDKSKIDLVEAGLFRYFRHPIYFCAVLIGIGTLLVIPSISTAFITVILWASVSTQARLEESFLLSKFGKKYSSYMKRRKRYF